ncbi:MAG: hypothetical protein ACOYJD_04970 [Christensenellales bacterium]|jgi:stage III sporulation protein AB
MLKAVLLVAGAAGCVVIGWLMSTRLRTRSVALEAVLHAHKAVEIQLEYTMKPAVEVMAHVKEIELRCHGLFAGAELGLQRGLSFEEAWKKALYEVKTLYCFEDSDINALMRFGSGFGKTDLEGQKKLLKLVLAQVQDLAAGAREEYAKKAGVYVRLGVLGGIALFVFFI